MSETQTIAKLVASLGFVVDDEQLTTFVTKLNQTVTLLKKVREAAKTAVSLKIGINRSELTGAKKSLSTLGDTKVRLKDVVVGPAAMANVRKQLVDGVALAKFKVSNIEVSPAAAKELRESVRTTMAAQPVRVSVLPNTRQFGKDLRQWLQTSGKQFKIQLQATINKHSLYTSLQTAIKESTDKVGTIKLKDPKVKVGIDKAHLRSEIKSALDSIKKEMRIKIDLTGHGSVSGAGGGRVGAGRGGIPHSAAFGGAVGGAMGIGRGFIPGLSGAFAVAQLSQMSQQMQGQRQAMTAVTGSQQAGGETMGRLRNMANEVGFSWRDVAPQFTKMIASGTSAGMGQGDVETIFKSLSEYGRVMGLDSEAMKGSFTAVEQMMNKQQIYAEELKTQLGERFPAAISMMAEAVSRKQGKEVTVPQLMDMMKKGLVDSSVLREFAQIAAERARAGGALDTAKESSAAQQARFNNAWSTLVEKFSESGFDKIMQEFWRIAADGLDKLNEHAGGLAKVFEALMRPVFAFIEILKDLDRLLPETSDNFKAMAGIIIGLMFPFTRFATILALVALVIEDIIGYTEGKDSLFGKLFEGLNSSEQEAALNFFNSIKTAMSALKGVGDMIYDGWKEIFKLFGEDSILQGTLDMMSSVANTIAKVATFTTELKNGAMPSEALARTKEIFQGMETTPDRREQLRGGLDLMKGAGFDYNGNKISKIPLDQANPEGTKISVDVRLTADEITQMMGNGTFGDFMTQHTEKGVKEWMARELGGAGARLVDYN